MKTYESEGLITGRNGHFDLTKVAVSVWENTVRIDGIGKSGRLLNAGISMDKTAFEQIIADYQKGAIE